VSRRILCLFKETHADVRSGDKKRYADFASGAHGVVALVMRCVVLLCHGDIIVEVRHQTFGRAFFW